MTAFWTEIFSDDEAQGLTIRVGSWRCTPVEMHEDRTIWICLEDSLEDGSEHVAPEEIQGLPSFETRQGAINWMVDQTLTQHEGEANAAMLMALENLMGWFGDDRSTWDGWEGVDEVIDQANAAIAKATEEVTA